MLSILSILTRLFLLLLHVAIWDLCRLPPLAADCAVAIVAARFRITWLLPAVSSCGVVVAENHLLGDCPLSVPSPWFGFFGRRSWTVQGPVSWFSRAIWLSFAAFHRKPAIWDSDTAVFWAAVHCRNLMHMMVFWAGEWWQLWLFREEYYYWILPWRPRSDRQRRPRLWLSASSLSAFSSPYSSVLSSDPLHGFPLWQVLHLSHSWAARCLYGRMRWLSPIPDFLERISMVETNSRTRLLSRQVRASVSGSDPRCYLDGTAPTRTLWASWIVLTQGHLLLSQWLTTSPYLLGHSHLFSSGPPGRPRNVELDNLTPYFLRSLKRFSVDWIGSPWATLMPAWACFTRAKPGASSLLMYFSTTQPWATESIPITWIPRPAPLAWIPQPVTSFCSLLFLDCLQPPSTCMSLVIFPRPSFSLQVLHVALPLPDPLRSLKAHWDIFVWLPSTSTVRLLYSAAILYPWLFYMNPVLLSAMENLNFTEEEAVVITDIPVEDEDSSLWLVGSVISRKPVDGDSVIRIFRSVWKAKNILAMVELQPNFFLIKSSSSGAMDMILKRRPWAIHDDFFSIKPYIPALTTTEEMGLRLGGCVGTALGVDHRVEGGNMGEFLRILVQVDIRKPLRRCVLLNNGLGKKASPSPLRYERLPDFCYYCGLVGHVLSTCTVKPDALDDKKLQYGSWLRVTTQQPRPQWRSGIEYFAASGSVPTEPTTVDAGSLPGSSPPTMPPPHDIPAATATEDVSVTAAEGIPTAETEVVPAVKDVNDTATLETETRDDQVSAVMPISDVHDAASEEVSHPAASNESSLSACTYGPLQPNCESTKGSEGGSGNGLSPASSVKEPATTISPPRAPKRSLQGKYEGIDPNKAPGIDGLPGSFFRQHWDLIGPEVKDPIIWRFLTEPSTLLTRVFRAKYFPTGHLFDAQLRDRASFAWKGLPSPVWKIIAKPDVLPKIRIFAWSEALFQANIAPALTSSSVTEALAWLEEAASVLSRPALGSFVTLLWNRRNRWVHSQQLQPVWVTVTSASLLHQDHLAVSRPPAASPALCPVVWSPPPSGTVTLNTDGSFAIGGGAGIGVVARDCSGRVLGGLARHLDETTAAEFAEHAALLAGLQLALERGRCPRPSPGHRSTTPTAG
ncbi:hypothetical protein V6N12_057259 [Hibiscus sabdariffa]|uniref:CCHC-type domain-containing protein n=1 Tax=Hibiscus sabdariffa TaxID=183260 RepID=A0ABR2DBC3_9ROSI